MKNKIKNIIKNSIFNKLVKIIYGPQNTEKLTFLEELLSQSSYNYFHITESAHLLEHLKQIDKYGVKTLVIIEHLCTSPHSEAIIDWLHTCENIDAYTCIDTNIETLFKDNMTLIRGRIQTIYYPNYLFEDYKEQYEDEHIIDYFKYMMSSYSYQTTHSEIEKNIINYLSHHIGEELSYYSMALSLHYNVNTVKTKCEYLYNTQLFNILNRFDIQKKEILKQKFTAYPKNYALISEKDLSQESVLKKFMMASIIEKLLYEGWTVYNGVYRNQKMINQKRQYYVEETGLVATKKDRTIYIAYADENISDIINIFNNINNSFSKIIISMGEANYKYDDNGIGYCGIEYFLLKGVE